MSRRSNNREEKHVPKSHVKAHDLLVHVTRHFLLKGKSKNEDD